MHSGKICVGGLAGARAAPISALLTIPAATAVSDGRLNDAHARIVLRIELHTKN